jgi:hypothetical protein
MHQPNRTSSQVPQRGHANKQYSLSYTIGLGALVQAMNLSVNDSIFHLCETHVSHLVDDDEFEAGESFRLSARPWECAYSQREISNEATESRTVKIRAQFSRFAGGWHKAILGEVCALVRLYRKPGKQRWNLHYVSFEIIGEKKDRRFLASKYPDQGNLTERFAQDAIVMPEELSTELANFVELLQGGGNESDWIQPGEPEQSEE